MSKRKELIEGFIDGMVKPEKPKKTYPKMAALAMIGIMFFVFMAGFHNADNCANWISLNLELKPYGIKYAENNLMLKDISATGCYQWGMTMMIGAGVWAFISLMIIAGLKE